MQVLYFSTAWFGTQFRLGINTNSFHDFAKHIKRARVVPNNYILVAFVVPNQVGELFVLSLLVFGSLLHDIVTSGLKNMD